MATSRRFVQITDKEINKIKITCVKILKHLFASGSVIFGRYSPQLRLGKVVKPLDQWNSINTKFLFSNKKAASVQLRILW